MLLSLVGIVKFFLYLLSNYNWNFCPFWLRKQSFSYLLGSGFACLYIGFVFCCLIFLLKMDEFGF